MLLRQASVMMMISGPSESLTWTVLNPAAMSFCMSAIATPFDCFMGKVRMSLHASGTHPLTVTPGGKASHAAHLQLGDAVGVKRLLRHCSCRLLPMLLHLSLHVVSEWDCLSETRECFSNFEICLGFKLVCCKLVSPARRRSELSFESHTSRHTVLPRAVLPSALGRQFVETLGHHKLGVNTANICFKPPLSSSKVESDV